MHSLSSIYAGSVALLIIIQFASNTVASSSSSAAANSPEKSTANHQRKDEERLGVLTVDLGNGPVSLPNIDVNTITAALINIVIFGGVVWFLLAVVFPLFGFKLCYLLGTCGDVGYDQYAAYDQTGYGAGYLQKR